jgi:phage terminase small subunit
MITTVDDNLRSDRQAAFVREYVKDFNATQAAIRAGYSDRTAQEQSSRLLSNAMVKAAIERRLEQIVAIAEVDAAMVVRELLDIATADPRELVSVHRDCCRYCYGIERRRQWTRAEYECALAETRAAGKPAPEFAGGLGYIATREPHQDCPECFGRGVEAVIVTDTRKLTGKAAKLYAGAQQTKDGVKALGRDQNAALMALGRYLGMFKERTEVSGPGGGPVQLQPVRPACELSNSELEEALRASGRLLGPLTEDQIDRIIGIGQ